MNACRHVHAYERHNRVFNYTLDDCAPYHVTIGMPQEHDERKPSMPQSCCILLSLFHVVLLACLALTRKKCCSLLIESVTAMEVQPHRPVRHVLVHRLMYVCGTVELASLR